MDTAVKTAKKSDTFVREQIVIAAVRNGNAKAALEYQQALLSRDNETIGIAKSRWMGLVNELREDRRIPSVQQVADKALELRHLTGQELDDAIMDFVCSRNSW